MARSFLTSVDLNKNESRPCGPTPNPAPTTTAREPRASATTPHSSASPAARPTSSTPWSETTATSPPPNPKPLDNEIGTPP